MPKPIFELRSFIGGMVRDLVKRKIPKTKYYIAENINLTPNSIESFGGASVSLGSKFAVDLGLINFENPNDDYQAWLIYLDLSAGSIIHELTYDNGVNYVSGPLSSGAGTPSLRYASLVTQINNFITALGFTGGVYINATPISGVVSIGVRVYGYTATLTETIAGLEQNVIAIKEFYGNDNGFFVPLKSVYINTNLYILSTNGKVIRLGVAQKDYATDIWTYTMVLQTNQIVIAPDAVVDMDGQIDFGERVSLYFTTEGQQPRCFYVKLQETWVANSAMQYFNSITLNPIGYYNYSTIATETALQIVSNIANVELDEVIDSGGALKSGNNQYFIRQLFSDDGRSGIGIGSDFVSIFRDSLSNTRLYGGNLPNEDTTKRVKLTVKNLNPQLYDKFELIYIHNTDGVLNAYLVNTFDITGEQMTVFHNGTEPVVDIALAEFATEQIIVKSAANLVIARNRLFLSNLELQTDFDLATWAKTITITTQSKLIDAVGDVVDTVNEYQKPNNIFDFTGYNNYEKYRYGIKLFFTNGFITSPNFISDYQILYNADADILTDDSTPPDKVRVLHPRFTVDLSYVLNGIPLNQQILGYSIVRQECIPEVLATGYVMPSNLTLITGDYYTTGNNVLSDEAYLASPTAPNRYTLAFLSPDILFGTVDIAPIQGDKILNFGNAIEYNLSTGVSGDIAYALREWGGSFGRAIPDELVVVNGEVVPFNQNGLQEIIAGQKLSTIVSHTDDFSTYGNNQKVLGLNTTGTYATSGSTTDRGFYYGLYYRTLTNKYGNEKNGSYIECGHFRATTMQTVYTDDVYGGDTFVQKSFIKFCNQWYDTMDLSSSFVNSPVGTFYTGAYSYAIIANMGGGQFVKTPYIIITTTGGNAAQSRVLTWTPIIGAVSYTVAIERPPADPNPSTGNDYYISVGTALTFTDSNVIVGTPHAIEILPAFFQSRMGLSYYTANKGNYQLRLFTDNTDLNYPYETTNLGLWLTDITSEGQLLYSTEFSPISSATTARLGYNPDAINESSEPSTAIYSNLKVGGISTDAYREFLPINKKYYPAKYGAITNTFLKDVNYLVIMMNEQILLQTLDQQQIIVDGTATIIGDGTVLGAQEQPLSNIGSPIKTGAIQYKNSAGAIHVIWYNPYDKKLLRYTGRSTDDIGEQTNNQSFLSSNNQFVLVNNDIIFGYDFMNDEVLMTTLVEPKDSDEYSSIATYDEAVTVWVQNGLNQKTFYTSLIEVPPGKDPSNIANQVQYWVKWTQSYYTITYNDKISQISDFLTYYPLRYLTFNETFLTQGISGTPSTSKLFEHNKGILLYDTDGDGTEIFSSITMVFNDVPDIYKVFRTLYFDIGQKPLYVKVKTDDYVTYTNFADINYSRPHWGANVYNDATIRGGTNPNGLNTLKTAQPSDQYAEVTVWFKSESVENANNIKEAILKMIPRPKYFNN